MNIIVSYFFRDITNKTTGLLQVSTCVKALKRAVTNEASTTLTGA